jgi:hypothetical protein
MSDARDYVSKSFGIDVQEVPDESIVVCIEQVYESGWEGYKADYERFLAPIRAAQKAHQTPIQQFAKMRAKVAGSIQVFRLKLHEEVVSVTMTDDRCEAVIRTCEVESRRSRDRLTEIGLKKITYVKMDYELPGGGSIKVWSRPVIEVVSIPTSEDILTWGRAWTAERLADLEWQTDTCFRPGTDQTPMDGPIRKLEISHEQAFAGEEFQDPGKCPDCGEHAHNPKTGLCWKSRGKNGIHCGHCCKTMLHPKPKGNGKS